MQPIMGTQLKLGLDCVLKMKHARDGLPQSIGEHDRLASDANALTAALYWACYPPDFDCLDSVEWRVAVDATVSILREALTKSASTGLPQRVRNPSFRWEGVVIRADEVVIRGDRFEIADIHPKVCDGPDSEFVSKRGHLRAEWSERVIDVSIKRLALSHVLSDLAPGRPIDANLVLLRSRRDAAAGEPVRHRTLSEFRLTRPPVPSDGHMVQAANLTSDVGSASEGSRTFNRVRIGESGALAEISGFPRRIEELRAIAEAGAWPDPVACLSLKCRSCEFRAPGPGGVDDSGFARCWGPGVDRQPHHILKLSHLSDGQLRVALNSLGKSATIRILPEREVRPSQRGQYVAARTQAPTVDQVLTQALAHGDAPAHFLSLATVRLPIPLCTGDSPYEPFPFQFSAYAVSPSARTFAGRRLLQGFLHSESTDSRLAFVRELRRQLGVVGRVYAWSIHERTAIRHVRGVLLGRGIIRLGDEDDAFLESLQGNRDGIGRLVELEPIARGLGISIGSGSRRALLRAAWCLPEVRTAFGLGHGCSGDRRQYHGELEPVAELHGLHDSLGGSPPIGAQSTDDVPMDVQRIFLLSRLLGKSDDSRIREAITALGDLRAASLLIAHHLLAMIACRPTDRAVRIFVSSTFRDFKAERDILKRRVEPELQRRAADRSVSISVIDLRWGITDEQAKAGMILPICLQEIARCRPYFIGLLGERYGWIPGRSAFSDTMCERMPWLRDHAGGASVTELEIRHGAFQADSPNGGPSFYFRSPAYARGRGPDFESIDQSEQRRLTKLKQAIRTGGFVVQENYDDPEDFGRIATEHLWQRIDAAFPREAVGTVRHTDIALHDAWAWSLCERYRPWRDVELRQVCTEIDKCTSRIMILGEAGSGKSSLVAEAINRYRGSMNHLVVRHFVGVGTTPPKPEAIAARIIGALAGAIGIDPPADPTSRIAFVELADRIRREQWHPVIAIDGLDAVQDVSQIGWLSDEPVRDVTILLTGLSAGPLDSHFGSTSGSRTRRVHLPPLPLQDRTDLVEHLLRQHGRSIDAQGVAAIVAHPASAQPGFIAAVVNELLMCGSFETLPTRLAECIASTDLAGLYITILRRIESEMTPGFVGRAMRLLAAAPNGIQETELVARLDGHQAEWSCLRLQVGEPIVESGGIVALRPGPFADAVRHLYGVSADSGSSVEPTEGAPYAT